MSTPLDRLTAALSRSYRLERELGQGGMATVYLAEDLRHGRQVAIKVMLPELAAAIGPDRFLREIRTTAKLRHPHIVPLFDSGDADGQLWYAMPFVEGESLQDRLAREGPLPLDDILRIAHEVASALGYAHGRGVIHRDIKPGNILLEAGHAVVADFGIASAVSMSDGAKLTQTGMIVGSPAYMSPEQATGEDIDGRSDLYSLGCVVYEMLTGQPPFTAPTAMVVLAKHMLDPVPPLATARPGLSAQVVEAVERLLAKNPADRFASSEAWISALDSPGEDRLTLSDATAPAAGGGFWVAVLPFRFRGAAPELDALAEGLTEDIVTGLSRFSYLRVISRSSAARFTGESVDARAAGRELRARYLMEGTLRQAGPTLRISAQLVDAESGAHLWAEHYDQTPTPEDLFTVQDDVASRIVSTVADMHGVLPHTMSENLRHRDPETLTPYEMTVRGLGYIERITPDEHALVRAGLERTVARAPGNADCWALLSNMYAEEHKHGFNPRPDPLGRALDAARRAVAAAPSSHLGYHMLAQAHFFRREFQEFRNAADRAVSLNPLDAGTVAFMGILMAYTGDWERGCTLAEGAMQLNPHHPGWYRFAAFNQAFRTGDYRAALDVALRFNMPSYFYTHMAVAAAYGKLGDREAAGRWLRELLAVKPDIASEARNELGKWMPDPAEREAWIDGLRRAGLDVAGEAAGEGESVSGLGEPTIAVVVLPFVNRSPDPGNEYFSDGLTEEIITDLSRLRALRVISRNSSMTLKGTKADTASIANQLGVTHIVTGSVRRAGDALRVTVELIEATSDSSLWSEKYSGTMADVFGIQEEIAQKIVAALEVRLTEAEAAEAKVVQRPIQDVVAWDCYLRARQELYAWTPDSMERAARLVDEALGIVGDNPLLLATQGQIAYMKVNLMFDPDERHLDRAAEYADRALAIAPDYYLGLFLRGIVAGLRGDTASAIRDTYRAHQLRSGDPNVLAEFCRFGNAAGVDVAAHVNELVRIDPLTPVTWLVVALNRSQYGQVEEVFEPCRRCLSLAPGASMFPIFVARIFAQAGLREEAIELLDQAGKTLAGTLHGSWALFLRYAHAGAAEAAVSHMTPLLERGASMGDNIAIIIAEGYSLIGRNDDALKWIRIGLNRGFLHYSFLANQDTLLANVRSDPRFPDVMQEAKTRWEALGPRLPEPLRLAPIPKGHP